MSCCEGASTSAGAATGSSNSGRTGLDRSDARWLGSRRKLTLQLGEFFVVTLSRNPDERLMEPARQWSKYRETKLEGSKSGPPREIELHSTLEPPSELVNQSWRIVQPPADSYRGRNWIRPAPPKRADERYRPEGRWHRGSRTIHIPTDFGRPLAENGFRKPVRQLSLLLSDRCVIDLCSEQISGKRNHRGDPVAHRRARTYYRFESSAWLRSPDRCVPG